MLSRAGRDWPCVCTASKALECALLMRLCCTGQVVPDNYQYSRLALAIKDKSSLSEESLAELTEITGMRQQICVAAY